MPTSDSDRQRRLRSLEQRPSPTDRAKAAATQLEVPNIIEFVTSPQYLDRPSLYPRQATLLKIFTLSVDLLTPYDFEVIEEWEGGFSLVDRDGDAVYEGHIGMAPGTVERMQACRGTGREWFREIVMVFGRRAGKGYLTSLLVTYLVWRILALGDPQKLLGIERTKQLSIMVMAADLGQATANQFRDIAEIIKTAPCFKPFVVPSQARKHIRLRTPADLAASQDSDGSLVIDARASTRTAGRGPAALALVFDEMAHAPASGLERGADEVYQAAKPALAQFKEQSFIVLASSPASQTGEFYGAYQRALATRDGQPVDPTVITAQLPSWSTYLDWESASGIQMWPGGPAFSALPRAVLAENDDGLERERQYNRPAFDREHRALWSSSPEAYLERDDVLPMFGTYRGKLLSHQPAGGPDKVYAMHCDPSVVGANFAIAIGHLDGDRSDGHVVFDYLHAFEPRRFEDGRIDYALVQEHIYGLILNFSPRIVTFDQYSSEQMIQNLNQLLRTTRGWTRETVSRRPATAAQNWSDAERFKLLLAQRRIHAPAHELAKDELLFLELDTNSRVHAPTTGPVRTDDLVDAMFGVVAHLMDGGLGVVQALNEATIRGMWQGGMPASTSWYQPPARNVGERRSGGRWAGSSNAARDMHRFRNGRA